MKKLTVSQIVSLHEDIIKASGGSDGVRDNGLLESAVNAPFQTFNGEPLYPSIQQKATRLAFSIVKNHPFIDGNKRIGLHVMLVFLDINGIELAYSQEELASVGLSLAAGTYSDEELLRWIIDHQV
jgi:death-on-curing protein